MCLCLCVSLNPVAHSLVTVGACFVTKYGALFCYSRTVLHRVIEAKNEAVMNVLLQKAK